MAVLHLPIKPHPRLASAMRWGELSLIPLSNDLAALIAWRTGLDLFPLLAAFLYIYIGLRHLRVWGLQLRWAWSSVGLAGLAGLLLAAPTLIFFVHPLFVGHVQTSPVTPLTVSELNGLFHQVLFQLPVATAIVEELVFRAFLYVELRTLPRTLTLNAALFTLWHVAAGFLAVRGTAFGRNPGLFILAYAGSLASVFVGGLVFAFVRHKTGSFVYSALTHWICDATILIALFATAHIA